MVGTVFREVLEDLQRESLHELAKEIEGSLRATCISWLMSATPMFLVFMLSTCHICLTGMPATRDLVWILAEYLPLSLVLSTQKSCTIGQLSAWSTSLQRPAHTQRAPATAPMSLPTRLCIPASRGPPRGSPLAASLPSTPPARKRSMCGPGGMVSLASSASSAHTTFTIDRAQHTRLAHLQSWSFRAETCSAYLSGHFHQMRVRAV